MENQLPKFYSMKEAGEILGVAHQTLKKMIETNQITYRNFGSKIRFTIEDLENAGK